MSDAATDPRALLRERLRFLREIGVRDLRLRPGSGGPSSARPEAAEGSDGEPEAAGGSLIGRGAVADEFAPAASVDGSRPVVETVPLPVTGGGAGLFDESFVLPEGADPAAALASLRSDTIGDCRRCKLSRGRRTIVFGSGNPRARLLFVGEGPGADEDAQGLPFVGRAGQKLTEMIEKGMGIPRADCYIANIVKCRPPDNRDPEPEEIAACEGFLFRQIDVIRPKIIVALGKFAAQTLLRSKAPISALRGRFFQYRDTLLMPTFHPAYLLRQYTPENRRLVWEDLKKVLEALAEPER